MSSISEPGKKNTQACWRVASAMQDCRTDCGCSRECPGYPRHVPCAWTVHATAQHHTVISTALPVCPVHAWEGDGLQRAGRAFWLFGWVAGGPHSVGSWVVPWLHCPHSPVPGFGSGPRSESGSFAGTVVDGCVHLPRPDHDGAGLIFGGVAKDSGGRRHTHTTEEARERGKDQGERAELGELVHAHVPCVPHANAVRRLCSVAANSTNNR